MPVSDIPSEAVWLEPEEAAELLGITPRVVRLNAAEGKYGRIRYKSGEKGGGNAGQVMEIPLNGLPAEAQAKYWLKRGLPAPAGAPDPFYATVGEQARVRADRRREILDTWEHYLAQNEGRVNKTVLTKEFVAQWNATHPDETVHMSTLYRYRDYARKRGSLVDRYSVGRQKAVESIPDGAWEAFLDLYFPRNLSQPSLAACYRTLEVLAPRNGWELPSLKTFERRLHRTYDRPAHDLLRKGEKYYNDHYAPFVSRDYTGLNAGDYWCSDHHEFDVLILGPSGKPATPWVTMWMDLRSRLFLGWVVSFNPNSETVRLAFYRAAKRQNGLPAEILIDNGKDYRCYDFAGGRRVRRKDADRIQLEIEKDFAIFSHMHVAAQFERSAIAKLGIQPHYAIPYHAQSKPVERAFETVKNEFSKFFETYRGGDTRERPENLNQTLKTANLLTLDEFARVFGDWAERYYNNRAHSGQGMDGRTPNEVFAACFKTRRHISDELLSLLLMRTSEPVKVGRQGVRLHNFFYEADELTPLQGRMVYLRYDPQDTGRVFVFDEKDRLLCQAASRQLVGWGQVTTEDLRAGIRKQREAAKEAKAGRPERKLTPQTALLEVLEEKRLQQTKAQAPKPEPEMVQMTRPDLNTDAKRVRQMQIEAREEVAAARATGTDLRSVLRTMPSEAPGGDRDQEIRQTLRSISRAIGKEK
ncbi:MAG: Mu transposase C-terminal domain-containing protein [Bacteroidota bacterium]